MSSPPFPLPVLNTSRIMAELSDPSPTRDIAAMSKGPIAGGTHREAYPATMRDTMLVRGKCSLFARELGKAAIRCWLRLAFRHRRHERQQPSSRGPMERAIPRRR